jgi:hypothetical protein
MEDAMTTKRAIWIVAVPVVVLMAVACSAPGILGIKHQGRTVSEVTPRERPKAAPTAGAVGPVIPKERRYKVEAVSFHAVDESGPDWLGSDEIYASWRDPKSGVVSITPIYEDVNTGDTVVLDPHQHCILPLNGIPSNAFPQACPDEGGVPGPFEFEVALFEADRSLFNFCPQHPGFINAECIDDDLIDQKTVSFTTAELEAAMPHVGDTFQEPIALRTFCGVPESQAGLDVYGCWATGPDYRFTYQITRLPDKDLPLHP